MSFAKFFHNFIIFVLCKNITSIFFEFIILNNHTYSFSICHFCYSHLNIYNNYHYLLLIFWFLPYFFYKPSYFFIFFYSTILQFLWLSSYLNDRYQLHFYTDCKQQYITMKYYPKIRLEVREKITKITEHIRHLLITQAIELDLDRSWTFIIRDVSQICKHQDFSQYVPVIFGLLHPKLVLPHTNISTAWTFLNWQRQ